MLYEVITGSPVIPAQGLDDSHHLRLAGFGAGMSHQHPLGPSSAHATDARREGGPGMMLCDGSDSPDTASRQGKGIARWLFPAALIAAGWFIFLQIPWHADDTGMMIVSASFANLQKFGMSHYAHQLAVNLPLMALIWIFGYSTTAYYIFAFIFYFMFAASIGLISDNILSQKSRFGPAFVILIIV